MDDDALLHEIGADLEHDDPRLAAYLDGRARSPRRHVLAWLFVLLFLPAFAVPLVLAPTVTLAVTAMLMGAAAPLVVCWWFGLPDS